MVLVTAQPRFRFLHPYIKSQNVVFVLRMLSRLVFFFFPQMSGRCGTDKIYMAIVCAKMIYGILLERVSRDPITQSHRDANPVGCVAN
jgi:hypothetical protein